jgi:hypothetical protein
VVPPSEAGRTLQQQLEDYLRKLHEQLDKMQTPRITDIWFEAGGVLQLPVWFVQWCAVKGIRLHGVELADVPTDIPDE